MPVMSRSTRLSARQAGTVPMHATALRVPLVTKLLGANALALAVFLGVLYAERSLPLSVSVTLAAVAAIIVFGALASVALLPLRGIEVVASRVRRGDFGARVGASPVADQDMKRI